jgi:transposase
MAFADKVVVRLTEEERDALESLLTTQSPPPAVRRRATILLLTDADGPDALTDGEIAEQLGITIQTVAKVRRLFNQNGLEKALYRKKPTGRQYRKLDGQQEAQLVALACSEAPEGRTRWTMKLLADKLVELEVVESIDPATVWRTLQKTNSSRG